MAAGTRSKKIVQKETKKTGKIIHDFDQKGLHLELLLKPEELEKSKLPKAQKEHHKKVYEQLFYKGKGKAYTINGATRYYRARSGYYTLELPFTDCSASSLDCKRESLGFKLGKASMNPSGNESVQAKGTSGGLFGRLMSYYIQIGENVRVRHIRVFDNEDLNYHGSVDRTNAYELAVKNYLKVKRIEAVRGAKGSEYFDKLEDIQNAMEAVYKNPSALVRDILSYEYEGNQQGYHVNTRSKTAASLPELEARVRVIILSKKYAKRGLGAENARLITQTKKIPKGFKKDAMLWDFILDEDLVKDETKPRMFNLFKKELYNKVEEGGWVLYDDPAKQTIFKTAKDHF
jgi:hypothetical protein